MFIHLISTTAMDSAALDLIAVLYEQLETVYRSELAFFIYLSETNYKRLFLSIA